METRNSSWIMADSGRWSSSKHITLVGGIECSVPTLPFRRRRHVMYILRRRRAYNLSPQTQSAPLFTSVAALSCP